MFSTIRNTFFSYKLPTIHCLITCCK